MKSLLGLVLFTLSLSSHAQTSFTEIEAAYAKARKVPVLADFPRYNLEAPNNFRNCILINAKNNTSKFYLGSVKSLYRDNPIVVATDTIQEAQASYEKAKNIITSTDFVVKMGPYSGWDLDNNSSTALISFRKDSKGKLLLQYKNFLISGRDGSYTETHLAYGNCL